ncbi:MAG: tRNA pseudouridine(38-40) synthase TruA [Bryobacterales bacterium]|nr:tRNA pseudouridine(38-40) synthase TruA [Bryobacterales bacterium]
MLERMPTWKVTVEYDGSRYSGWQEQKNAPKTVMGALRDAIESTLGVQAELHGAGRTDAGVHALAQVLHVKGTPGQPVSPSRFRSAVNDALGHDIAILAVEEVPERFHARHHAESRRYLYRISLRKNAFAKRHVWWVKETLDESAMRNAAAMLPGRHDFTAFHADDPARPDESPIVVVESASLERTGEELQFRIEASHFLWRMVRRLAGALVQVGKGEFPLADFAAALDGDVRYQDAISRFTAPAAGLYLEAVRYPADLNSVVKPSRKSPSGGVNTPVHRSRPSTGRGTPRKRSDVWRPDGPPKKNGRGKPHP